MVVLSKILKTKALHYLFMSIPTLICVCILYVYQKNALVTAHKKILQIAVNQKVDEMNMFMEAEQKMFEEVASPYKNARTIQKNTNPAFRSITLIDISGSIIDSQDSTHIGKNIFKSSPAHEHVAESATRALMGLTTDVSHLHQGADDTSPTLIMSTAIFLDKRLTGVLSAHYDIARLYAEIAQKRSTVQQGVEFFAIMQTKKGIQCAAPSDKGKLKVFDVIAAHPSSPLARAVNGERGSDTAPGYAGKRVIMAFQYLPLLSWGVIAQIHYSVTFYPLLLMRLLLLILSLITLLAGLAYFFPNQFLKTVHTVKKKYRK